MPRMIIKMLYDHLAKEQILPEEQKGSGMNIRGIKNKLFINIAVLKECKRRYSNLDIAWILFILSLPI